MSAGERKLSVSVIYHRHGSWTWNIPGWCGGTESFTKIEACYARMRAFSVMIGAMEKFDRIECGVFVYGKDPFAQFSTIDVDLPDFLPIAKRAMDEVATRPGHRD